MVLDPPITEGAGNAGCWPQPMARLQKSKQAAVTTGTAESSRHSLRDGFNAYSALSPGTGLSCPRRRAITARLGLSVGRPGPHAFTSASAPFVRTNDRARRQGVHRIPRSTCRDDRPKRPSASEAGRGHHTSDFRDLPSDLFWRGGLDMTLQMRRDLPVGHAAMSSNPVSSHAYRTSSQLRPVGLAG